MTDDVREDRVAPRTAVWMNGPERRSGNDRRRVAEATSLDSDELRSVLRVVAGDRHRALGHPGFFADCAVSICNEVRALLSAGDKAEAPLDE